MLLEFRVRNYKSFREETVLSMIANSDKALLQENTVETGIRSLPRALKTAVVYGANASGKSNLLRALGVMQSIILDSASFKPDQLFNIQPFLFDKTTAEEPTHFEITLLLNKVRYQYGFELNQQRIINEWLLVYQHYKPQQWFNRYLDPDSNKQVFQFGTHLTGQKRIWEEATRENALFLSTAVQLNSEKLRPLYNWFAEFLLISLNGGIFPFQFSTDLIQTEKGQKAMRSILSGADVGISSIWPVKKKGLLRQFSVDLESGQSESLSQDHEMLFPVFQHTNSSNKSVYFGWNDESQGTQKLFSLAAPLLEFLDKGGLLVIDELDNSLHPLLVRQILKTFHDPEANPQGCQLFFSTHDTSLLCSDILRRDQIWFTEKDNDQASRLTSLSEFSPRKNEALEKRYLSGRYGGVPILSTHLIEKESREQR